MKKKKFKQILSMILVFVLTVSMSMTSFAGELPEETINEQTEEIKPKVETEIEEPNIKEVAQEETTDKWTAEDFTYTTMRQTLNGCDYTRQFVIEGSAIAGFSENGEKKLEKNKNLVLPSVNDKGETLVGVADYAFRGKGITSVKFPEGMMVDYDDTVTHVVTKRGNFVIGTGAFEKNNLTSVYLPKGVIAIMPSAFKNNQLTKVSIPSTIWWIENSCFAYNKLSAVGFPKTCDFQAQIHAFAFAHNNIKSVRLPDYMEVVEKKAFYWNPGMEKCPQEAPDKEQKMGGVVHMYTDNPNLANMERIHHIERTAESQKSWHQRLIVGNAPQEEKSWNVDDFVIEGTKITGLSAKGMDKRKVNKNLVLPDKNKAGQPITEIAGTTETVGLFATAEEKIDSVSLPMYLEKIGKRAFANSGLKRVEEFPSTLKEIGMAAFQMNELTSVILPDSLTTLGGGAFGSNSKLEVIILSKGLQEIPAGAFGCSTAQEYMTNLTKLTIPEGVTKIGNNAFAGNNIKDIIIPSTVKEIGDFAFSTKNYLKEECTLTLSEGLEKIGKRAFRNKVIAEVELPSTVKSLSDKVFEKEYSDDTQAVKTKVYVNKKQYSDKQNFPASDYHEYVLKIDKNDTEWDAYDFTYGKISQKLYPAHNTEDATIIEGTGITGLSAYGEAKLELNKNVVIPKKDTDGKTIIGIGEKAFQKKGIESVIFPEGVMTDYHGNDAAEGVTKRGNFIIQSSAFAGNELTSVNLPEGVIYVGNNAFKGNKLGAVSMSHTIWQVASQAFAANQITTVDFPKTCDFKLNLDNMSFAQNKIRAVRLPDRTEKVTNSVFFQCTGMEPVAENAPNANYKKGGVVYMYTDNADLKKESYITHTEGVGTGVGASGTKSWVQKLIVGPMPEELKPWNENDFTYEGTVITGLSESGTAKRKNSPELVLPDKNPQGQAITGLKDATSSYGLFASEKEKFNTVVLPKNLEKIGKNVFADSGLTKVVFPETLTEIDNGAFRQNNLVHIVLPDSIKKLGTGIFASNFTVETIKFPKNITEIPSGMFSCSGKVSAEKFTEITLPEGITKIGNNAFAGNNFAKVVIPKGVKEIGGSAFAQTQDHRALKEIVLPEGLESIGRWAFRYALVKEVNLPSTVTELNKDAFKDSEGKVTLYVTKKEQLENHGKFVAQSSYHQTVYNNLVGTGWNYDDFIFEGNKLKGWSAKGNQTRLKNKKLVLPEINPETKEEVTIIDNGAFKIPDNEVEQLKDGVISPNGMNTIQIPETVTVLGEKAFEYNNFKTVDFPKQLQTVGLHCFHGNKLEGVIIPDSVTDLQSGAFSENNITKIKLPKELKTISQGVFSMNIRLEKVEIPETVTEIGDMAFAGARLSSLHIPNSVVRIGRKAFHLHHLKELTIPGNVKEIGDSAFEGTFKAITLKKLVLQEGIESIGSCAFKEGYLESVKLPKSLKVLADDAFEANAGTNNDHVVVCYTENVNHLEFPTSKSHRIVLQAQWDSECFVFEGNKVVGLSKKGLALIQENKEMIIPDRTPAGVTILEIGADAFRGYGIMKVQLPKGLQIIGEKAFAENKLQSVDLPNTVRKIAENSFEGHKKDVQLLVHSQDTFDCLNQIKYKDAVLVNLAEEKPEEKPDNKPDNKPNGNQDNNQSTTGNQPINRPAKTGDTAPITLLMIISGVALLLVWTQTNKKKNK
ncbi:MAG: leucine-rich repeat domain-containing protein [Lachnospiraceae bacterium]|nr:leucine-rich repeat domain-containing protein [Lachnospiraceae bacterium]